MNGNPKIKEEYLEAVRLYLWHTGSEFSYHKGRGKQSKELAERYHTLLHKLYEDYIESTKANQNSDL